MSYGFSVAKVDATLVFVSPEHLEQVAAHVPDGAVFAISGHEPSEGYSAVASLAIGLSVKVDEGPGEHVAAATSTYNTKRREAQA